MKKYIGQYRVSCEFCRNTLRPIKEDTFIVCRKDGQVYRIDDNTLAYYRPTKGVSSLLCKKLIDLGVSDVKDFSSDGDILISFNEEYLNIVADEVGASVLGANVNPYSIRNLRRLKWFKDNIDKYIELGLYENPKELTEKEKEMLRERFKANMKR